MKKLAFTLAEVTLVLVIIGILAIVMIKNIKTDTFKDKELKAGAVKVINDFNIASMKIREIEHDKCPSAAFMVKAGSEENDWVYTLIEKDEKDATKVLNDATKVLDLYGEYLKFDKPRSGYYNFCDHTGGLKDEDCKDSANIAGIRLAGDIYVGLKMNLENDVPKDCPTSYYRINTAAKDETPGVQNQNDEVTISGEKCWAKLYMDINGNAGPNEVGQDIFVYGMNSDGVLY